MRLKLISIPTRKSPIPPEFENKTIRELEEKITELETEISTLATRIETIFNNQKPDEEARYSTEFFEEIIPLLQEEQAYKTLKETAINLQKEKIDVLIKSFPINGTKKDLSDFIYKIRQEIDKPQKGFSKLKLKKAKIENFYLVIQTLNTSDSPKKKAEQLIAACNNFLEDTKKDSKKGSFIKAFQHDLSRYLDTPISFSEREARTVSQKIIRITDIDLDLPPTDAPQLKKEVSETTQIRQIKRKSIEDTTRILTSALSQELEGPIEEIKLKLKKILLLNATQKSKSNYQNDFFQETMKKIFDRIDNDFTSAIQNVRPKIVYQNGAENVELESENGTTYSLGKPLGQGSNGSVWEVTTEQQETPLIAKKVAIGILGLEPGINVQSPIQVFTELNLIYELGLIQNQIPHFIMYKDFFIVVNQKNETVELVSIMEKLDQTLDTKISDLAKQPSGPRVTEALQMLNQIAVGLLRNQNIHHGDLKAGNIGLDSNGNYKMFDFGSTHKTGDDFEGSKYHRAPEYLLQKIQKERSTSVPEKTSIIQKVKRRSAESIERRISSTEKNGSKLDIFALGVVAFQMLVGDSTAVLQTYPNPPQNEGEDIDPCESAFDLDTLNEVFRHEKLKDLTQEEKEFFKSLAMPGPNDRPSLAQIFQTTSSLLEKNKKRGSGFIAQTFSEDVRLLRRQDSVQIGENSTNVIHNDPDLHEYILQTPLQITDINSKTLITLETKSRIYLPESNSYSSQNLGLPNQDVQIIIYTDPETKNPKRAYTIDPILATQQITFLSHSDITDSIFEGNPPQPKPEDINQRGLGDCYFVAVLASLARTNPDFITTQLIRDNQDGTVSVFFRKKSKDATIVKEEVRIKKTLPKAGPFSYLSAGAPWVGLVEKAYAIWKASSYAGIEGGFATQVFEDIFGDPGKTHSIESNKTILLRNPCTKNKDEELSLIEIIENISDPGLLTSNSLQVIASKYDLSLEELFEKNRHILNIYLQKAKLITNKEVITIDTPIIPSIFQPYQPAFIPDIQRLFPDINQRLSAAGFLKPCTVQNKDTYIVTRDIYDTEKFLQTLGLRAHTDLSLNIQARLKQAFESPKLNVPAIVPLQLQYPNVAIDDLKRWITFLNKPEIKEMMSKNYNPNADYAKAMPLNTYKQLISKSGLSNNAKQIFLQNAETFCIGSEQQTPTYTPDEIELYTFIEQHFGNIPNQSQSLICISTGKYPNSYKQVQNSDGNTSILFGPHMYEVVGCETNEQGKRLIHLRNPHGLSYTASLDTSTTLKLNLDTVFEEFNTVEAYPFPMQKEGNISTLNPDTIVL